MTDKVSEQALAQTELAEQKVTDTIHSIKKSKMGKNLPSDIYNIHIADIIKFLLVSGFFNFFPLFLMFGSEYKNKFDFFRKVINCCFIISFILAYFLALGCYVAGAKELYKFTLVALVFKLAFAAVLMVLFTIGSFLGIIIAVIYMSYLAIQDMYLLYQLGILMSRLEDEKYDDYGVKITDKVEEKV